MVGTWQTRILLIARFIHGSLGRFLGGRLSSPSRGHVAQPEGFRGLARAPRPGDTWLTRKVSGSSLVFLPGTRGSTGGLPGARPQSPSQGHVAQPEGFREPVSSEGSPSSRPGDTWL